MRLTLHNRSAGAVFICSVDTLSTHSMDGFNPCAIQWMYPIMHRFKCARPCLPADMSKCTKRRVLLPRCGRKLTATNRCPKDNSDPTWEGNQTLLSAESDLAGYALKNSSVYPHGVSLSVSVGYFRPNLEGKHSPTDQVQFMTPGKKSSNKITDVLPVRGLQGCL